MDDLIYDKQFNTLVINVVTKKQNIKTIYQLILNPGIKEIDILVINVTLKLQLKVFWKHILKQYMKGSNILVINVTTKQHQE